MKTMMKKAQKKAVQARTFFMIQSMKMRGVITNNCGENYVDSAVKILIAVVLGGLLLAGLYALFGDVVIPTLETKIKEMFNYAG